MCLITTQVYNRYSRERPSLGTSITSPYCSSLSCLFISACIVVGTFSAPFRPPYGPLSLPKYPRQLLRTYLRATNRQFHESSSRASSTWRKPHGFTNPHHGIAYHALLVQILHTICFTRHNGPCLAFCSSVFSQAHLPKPHKRLPARSMITVLVELMSNSSSAARLTPQNAVFQAWHRAKPVRAS